MSEEQVFPQELETRLSTLPKDKQVFIYVFGDWCPDCIEAHPIIEAAFQSKADPSSFLLLKCPVIKEEYKNNPEFLLRRHPLFQLKAIPSLYRWSEATPASVLVEDECKVLKDVIAFVE
jgi:thiol-disulfide isomerase/thioredoxin